MDPLTHFRGHNCTETKLNTHTQREGISRLYVQACVYVCVRACVPLCLYMQVYTIIYAHIMFIQCHIFMHL